MTDKKILDMEELMIDYGEMTSFDFNSLDYKQTIELQRITQDEYSNQPADFKYGKFSLIDILHSFIPQKEL